MLPNRTHDENPGSCETEEPRQRFEIEPSIGPIAHDLNNVLTATLIYTGLLLKQVGNESPLRKQLEQVNTAAEQGRGLVAGLLRLARRQSPAAGEKKRTSF